MTAADAAQQLRELEPVPEPPPGPTYEYAFGNQIRWAAKVVRWERYRRRVRRLQKRAARQ